MSYQIINEAHLFKSICKKLNDSSWIGLDTEFIGENTFYTELCLIQVSSEDGIFLFDPLNIPEIDPFIDIITNPAVTKIVHAGENDFRIFYDKFNIIPINVFDTQLATGFIGFKYPISFRDLVSGFLNKEINKAYSLVDWKKRPLPDHFIRYAVNDVLFLKPLYDLLQNEMESLNRTKWFIQESNKFYSSEFYQLDPYKDFKKSQIADKLDLKHKLFLFRLLNWRNQKAKDQNVTKEAILPSKIIPYILKGISIGQSPLEQSRRIPDGLLKKYLQDWLNLFGDPPLDWELEIIKELNTYEVETPEISIKYELFYNAVQLFCLQNKIAIELVLPRSLLKELKINKEKGLEMIQNSWRKDFFGQTFLNIVHRIGEMQIELSQNKITLG